MLSRPSRGRLRLVASLDDKQVRTSRAWLFLTEGVRNNRLCSQGENQR